MKITAMVTVSDEEKGRSLYSEEEWDVMIYRDISIRFAQELHKMSPLLQKADEQYGTRYQMQGIVLSMDSFKQLMEDLQTTLPMDAFERIRHILNNKI